MIREPSRRALLAVRGSRRQPPALRPSPRSPLTLGGATASPGGVIEARPGSSTRLAERCPTRRCVDAAGKTIVRTRERCDAGGPVRARLEGLPRRTARDPRRRLSRLTRWLTPAQAPCRPAPDANRAAPSSASAPRDRIPCSSSARSASCSCSPSCSSTESRSLRRQSWGSAASSWASASAACAGLSRRHDPVDEPHGERLGGTDRPAGQDQVQGTSGADQPRQPHRATVDERHAPPSAEDPEHRVLGGHPQVAPDRQLEPAGHGVPLDRRDHRLAEPHPGRAHRAVAHPSGRRPGCRLGVPIALRSAPAQNVPPAPVSTATRAPGSASKARKASARAVGGRAVDGVPRLRTVDDHRRDLAVGLDVHVHAQNLPHAARHAARRNVRTEECLVVPRRSHWTPSTRVGERRPTAMATHGEARHARPHRDQWRDVVVRLLARLSLVVVLAVLGAMFVGSAATSQAASDQATAALDRLGRPGDPSGRAPDRRRRHRRRSRGAAVRGLPAADPQGAPRAHRRAEQLRRFRKGDRKRSPPVARSGQGGDGWRWRWDLNPRWACTHTRFRGVLLRPLGHATAGEITGGDSAPPNRTEGSSEGPDRSRRAAARGPVRRPRPGPAGRTVRRRRRLRQQAARSWRRSRGQPDGSRIRGVGLPGGNGEVPGVHGHLVDGDEGGDVAGHLDRPGHGHAVVRRGVAPRLSELDELGADPVPPAVLEAGAVGGGVAAAGSPSCAQRA